MAGFPFSNKELLFHSPDEPAANAVPVDQYTPAQLAALPLGDLITKLAREYGVNDVNSGWERQWREWCSERNGSMYSMLSGSAIIATPIGREFIRQHGARVGADSTSRQLPLLHEVAYWLNGYDDTEPLSVVRRWLIDLKIGFFATHPDVALSARQQLPPEIFALLFREDASLASGEQPLPEMYTDSRMVAASFCGSQGVPGAVHQLWGPDLYWRLRSDYVDKTNDAGEKSRLLVKHLLETGFLTDERLRILQEIALSHVCDGLTRGSDRYFRRMNNVGVFHLLSSDVTQTEMAILQDPPAFDTINYLYQVYPYATDISAYFTPQLVQFAIDLLDHLGWRDAESWVLPPLWVLENVHRSCVAGVDPSLQGAAGKVQAGEISSYRHLFRNTLVGRLLLTIEYLAMHVSSAVAFNRDLHDLGHQITEPSFVQSDAGVSILGSFPEQFSTIYGQVFAHLVEVAQSGRRRLLGVGRDGRWADGFDKLMVRHYERQSHTHVTFFGDLYPVVQALVGEEALPKMTHLQIFEALVYETTALFESMPKAQTPRDEDIQRGRQLLSLLSRYFRVQEIYYGGELDRGGFESEGLHQIVESFETVLQMQLHIVTNDLVIEPGVPLTLLGANGQGKSSLMAMLLQHLYPTVSMIGSQSSTPQSTRTFTIFDGSEQHGTAMVTSSRSSGKSSFMKEVEELAPVFQQLLTQNERSLVVTGDEVGKRTDQLNGMSLAGALIVLTAAEGAISLNGAHYNTLPPLLDPVLKKCGLTARWATLHQHKLIEGSELVFTSRALENAARFLPKELVRTWSDYRSEGALPADAADDYVVRSHTALNRESLTQLGWLEQRTYFDQAEHLTGLGGYLLGSAFSDMRLCELEKQNSAFLQAKFISHPDVHALLVDTMLNPRWKLNRAMKRWVVTLTDQQVHETQEKYAGVSKLIQLILDGQWLRSQASSLSEEAYEQAKSKLVGEYRSIQKTIPQLNEELEWLAQAYPELQWHGLHTVLQAVQQTNEVLAFSNAYARIVEHFAPIFILQSLCCVVNNAPLIGLCTVTHTEEPTFAAELQDLWGAGLAPSLKRRRESLVKNSIPIHDSTFFAGCQGSGKTEAIIAIAEALTTAQLFNLAPASAASLSAQPFEVLPLISVPQWQQREGKPGEVVMPLSGWQREAANRIAAIVSFCESLPSGVAPVVVLDELGVSTDPIVEGSEIIQVVTQYVEERGGVVIMSTHCHQALWDMAAKKQPHQVMSVTPFWEETKYRWVPGHGESLGLETAARLGIHPTAIKIAEILRGYFLKVGAGVLSPDELAAVQDSTADALKVILFSQSAEL